MKCIFLQMFVSLFCSVSILRAAPQGTAFTYQGVLRDVTGPASGQYVMQFALFDAVTNGNPVGSAIALSPVAVSNGLFHVQLDFGAGAFSGDERWLDISVRTNDPALTTFATLHPRQSLTSQPYAIRAAHFSGSIADTQLSANVALLDVPNTSTQATGVPSVTSGFITGAIVTSGGSGYTAPPVVTVNAASGSGAVVTATVSGGSVTALTVQNAGSGYSSGATLTIAPPPSNAYQVFSSTNYFTRANSLTNTANIIAGNGAGLFSLNAAQLTSGTVPAAALNNAWRLIGNGGTTAGTHFLGTTDNQALEVRVNNQRALRVEPGVAPNLIGGVAGNVITPGRVGGVIGGGAIQSIDADYGTIGGGQSNSVGEIHGTIGGGAFNRTAGGPASTVSGGFSNAAAGHYTAVGGGLRNTAVGFISAIGGGQNNTIETNADHATIAGGLGNRIQQGSFRAFIGGGDGNTMQTNADFSVIGGGQRNTISSNAVQCTIGGGSGNDIGTNTVTCFVGGGFDNNIGANTASSAIAGGAGNTIGTNADWTVITGGNDNDIGPNSTFSVLVGGLSNDIGTNSMWNALGGGDNNRIGNRVGNSFIGGGRFSNIGDDSTFVVVAGGFDNRVSIDSQLTVIGGGDGNNIGSNTLSCVIAGGEGNVIGHNSRYATIPGGFSNYATNQAFAAGSSARALHSGAFVWADSVAGGLSSTNANSVSMRASGGYRLYSNAGATVGAFLAPGGGAWAAMSDRNAKENFEPVNARAVLDKVAALPMSTWNYKSQSEDIRHIGPMAQDFKAAFGVGEAETTITSIDADGVALAAIQGLNQKLQEELKRRDAENVELKQRLARLEELLLGAKTR